MPAKLTRVDRVAEIEHKVAPPHAVTIEPDVIKFAQNTLGFTSIDLWQSDFLLNTESKRIILNCCRQSGKTTIVAIAAIYQALTVPGSLILVVSPTLRQSQLLFNKILDYYERVGRPIEAERETSFELKLKNLSHIFSLPGSESTVRGFSSVDLILVDEAARVDDELFSAVLPMLLVSKGRIVLLSTPFGYRGYFSDRWHEAANDWVKVKITADDCPRITPEAIKIQKENMLQWQALQELYCSFESSQLSLLSESAIKAMFNEAVNEWEL